MKKWTAGVLVIGLSTALLSGCASVQTSKNLNGQKIDAAGTPVAHIHAKNSGYYLLGIPLIAGQTEAGSVGKIGLGKDTVNVSSMVDVVTRESKALGGTKTVDLSSRVDSMPMLPIPFVFTIESVQVSGNSVK
ncbi:MAG TPA: hypothetical protein PLD51_02095 [Pontiellaceae bacterium]|nr:hypothetical protein [Pontiellaceae bacterium]HPR82626.1 hypothetical protein [Pontiellaceae bacterium]